MVLDITNERISGDDLNRLFGKSKIRVLAGCAPCQPFSTYAQKYDVKRDDKWSLLKQFSRLIKESSPEIVTMENVPSVYKHEVFDSFVRSLKRRGYYVWHGIVDSSLYGAPQSRKRMVLLASLFGEIKFIDPTQKKQKTVQEVIGRLERIQAGRSSAKDPLHATRSLSQINYERIKASRPGGTWRDWPEHLVAEFGLPLGVIATTHPFGASATTVPTAIPAPATNRGQRCSIASSS